MKITLNKKMAGFVALGATALITGCGKKSSSSTGVSDISSLPAATAPVTASSGLKAAGVSVNSATTGLKLSAFSGATWGAGKSRGMCEIGRIVRDSYINAQQPDKVLCYIGAMKKNGLFGSDVDDGNYKFYSMTPPNDDSNQGAMKIKFKVVKSGDTVQKFEMFNCHGSTMGEYISQDISNPDAVSITTVGINSQGSSTFGGRTTVTGKIDSSGAWTEKTLTSTNSGGDGTNSFGGSAEVVQDSSKLSVSAYFKGSFGGHSFDTAMFGIVQGLAMDSMSTFALGDGTVKFTSNFDGNSGGSGTQSWNGDTLAPLSSAADGDHYATVTAGSVPTVGTPTVAFASSETWNCSADSSFSTVNFSAAGQGIVTDLQACDAKFGADDRTWVDCHAL